MQQFGLEYVQRVGIDITQLDGLRDPRQVGHQVGIVGDGQHHVDVSRQQFAQLFAQLPQFGFHQTLIVIFRQPQIGF